jgi:hypothetical protein
MLFDLMTDPQQARSLVDDALEMRMATMLVELMRASEAPAEQYVRLGLPQHGAVTEQHLVLGRTPAGSPANAGQPGNGDEARESDALADSVLATMPLRELLADPERVTVLRGVLGAIVDAPLPDEAMDMTLLQIATVTAGMVPMDALVEIAGRLRDAQARTQ